MLSNLCSDTKKSVSPSTKVKIEYKEKVDYRLRLTHARVRRELRLMQIFTSEQKNNNTKNRVFKFYLIVKYSPLRNSPSKSEQIFGSTKLYFSITTS